MKYPDNLEDFIMLPTILQDVVINGTPSVDHVLDIRLELAKLKDEGQDDMKEYFESEITACDIVLKVLQQLQDDNIL